MEYVNGVTQRRVDDVSTGNDRDWLFDRFGATHAVSVTIDLAGFTSVVEAGDNATEGTIPSGIFLKIASNGTATVATASETGVNAVLADPIRVQFTKTGLKGNVVVSAMWAGVIRRDRIKNNSAQMKFETSTLFEYDGKSVPTLIKSAA